MKRIIDSHFHIQCMKEKGIDTSALFTSLFEQGFIGGIDAGCYFDDLAERSKLLKEFPSIKIAGAMGPWEAEKENLEDKLNALKADIQSLKVNIIGEIGLDYYWKYGTKEKQFFLFEEQMKLANAIGAPVLIHDRDANEDTIAFIRRLSPSKGGIIHCFDGCLDLMKQALDKGYYISFAGNLTYKSSRELRDSLKQVPLDRLLFETDSPYLTPVPHRGEPNSPAFVIHTYECASQVLDMPLEKLKEQVLENYKNFIGHRICSST